MCLYNLCKWYFAIASLWYDSLLSRRFEMIPDIYTVFYLVIWYSFAMLRTQECIPSLFRNRASCSSALFVNYLNYWTSKYIQTQEPDRQPESLGHGRLHSVSCFSKCLCQGCTVSIFSKDWELRPWQGHTQHTFHKPLKPDWPTLTGTFRCLCIISYHQRPLLHVRIAYIKICLQLKLGLTFHGGLLPSQWSN
jgi:hypothetical protein